jgi:putative oxidoreductase
MIKMLQLAFIPQSVDLALLVLRVSLGGQMILAHGWGKLASFPEMAAAFPDPLHIGHTTSAALAITGEVLCSLLIALGFFTRPAAIGAIITMSVAFVLIHGAKLVGEHNGELAFLYLVGFVTIFLAGPGRFSIDSKLAA